MQEKKNWLLQTSTFQINTPQGHVAWDRLLVFVCFGWACPRLMDMYVCIALSTWVGHEPPTRPNLQQRGLRVSLAPPTLGGYTYYRHVLPCALIQICSCKQHA